MSTEIAARAKRSRPEMMPKPPPLITLATRQAEPATSVLSVPSVGNPWSLLDQQCFSSSVGQQSVANISFDDPGCWLPSSSTPWESSTAQSPPIAPSQLDSLSSSNLFDEDIFGVYTTYSPEEMLNND